MIKNLTAVFLKMYFPQVLRVKINNLRICLQVTIAPRAGRELGYVRMKMDSVKFNDGFLTYEMLFFLHCWDAGEPFHLAPFFDLIFLICLCFLIHGSRQSLLDHITVQLAPRAADEIWFGEDQVFNKNNKTFSLCMPRLS